MMGRPKKYTDNELLKLFKEKVKELDRIPIVREFNSDPNMPYYNTYIYRFESLENIIKLAGLENMQRKGRNMYSKEDLLDFLKIKTRELGKTPTQTEINQDYMLPSATTYTRRFGSLNKAFKAAGLKVRPISYSKEELIEIVAEKIKKEGRIIDTNDLKEDEDMPGYNIYYRKFGKWDNVKEIVNARLQS